MGSTFPFKKPEAHHSFLPIWNHPVPTAIKNKSQFPSKQFFCKEEEGNILIFLPFRQVFLTSCETLAKLCNE